MQRNKAARRHLGQPIFPVSSDSLVGMVGIDKQEVDAFLKRSSYFLAEAFQEDEVSYFASLPV